MDESSTNQPESNGVPKSETSVGTWLDRTSAIAQVMSVPAET